MKVPVKIIIPSLFLICVWLSYATALEVPEYPIGRITDFTSTLSPDEISHLDKKLADFEKQTTNQIAVLIIPSLEGDNLEDYSIRLADKWKIGQKNKDNGVILLIVKNDRKLRIEVGYGLEGVLPDGLAGSIIRNEITPLFKRGQYFLGIYYGTDAIINAINPTVDSIKVKERKLSFDDYRNWIVAILCVLFFFIYLPYQYIKHSAYARKHGIILSSAGGGFSGGGDFSGGGGLSGGGGFSGGGGGFGGGGASGDW